MNTQMDSMRVCLQVSVRVISFSYVFVNARAWSAALSIFGELDLVSGVKC